MTRPRTGRGRSAHRVALSLTAEEARALSEAADRAGLPVATWARLRAVEAARRENALEEVSNG